MELFTTLERRVPVLLLACGLGTVALTGCGGPVLEPGQPGTVVERDYDAAYVSFVRKTPVYHAADYDLRVRQCGREGDDGADKNGCVTAWEDVSKEVYDAHPVGSTYTPTGK